MAGSPILGFVSLILLAGGIVLDFFIVLSGAVNGSPLNKVYFLSAQLNSIPNSKFLPKGNPSAVAWTYFALCDYSNGQTSHCKGASPAFPFNPQAQFGLNGHSAKQDLGGQFVNTDFYFLMSRFAWVFYLIALFFGVVSLFTGLLALCSRIGAWISGFATSLATFFQLLAAALMTAWVVKARDGLNSHKPSAKATLGKYAMGFTWASFACFFLSMILFCVGGATSGKKKDTTYKEGGGGGGFFGKRSRSTRSTRDGGVKDEYE